MVAAEPTFSFLLALTLVLAVAHALGFGADRLGFAPVVGELLTGVVLGPSVLGVLAPGIAVLFVPVDERLAGLAGLGLVLLVVLAGTEVDVPTVRRHAGTTLAVATGAFAVPFALGFAFAWLLPARFLVAPATRLPFALFLATALSISALPVAVRVLADLDALDRPVGQVTLTTAVAVDATGWLALAVVADVARLGALRIRPIAVALAVLAVFTGAVLAVGPPVVARLFALAGRARTPALTGFSLAVVVGFAVTSAAVGVGVEAVVGAFLAGVVVGPRLDADAARVFHVATLGLFAPLFFATAGLRADLTALAAPGAVTLTVATLAVAVVGKVAGVFVGAAVTDLSRAETWCLAIGLNARGAMEIVVATVGLSIGVLTPLLYAVVVLVAVVTSVMTPPLLRRALARLPESA